MKTHFSLTSHIEKKYSLVHTLLAALIGGDYKIGILEMAFKILSEFQILGILMLFPYQYLFTGDLDALNSFLQGFGKVLTFQQFVKVSDNAMGSNILFGAMILMLGGLVAYTVLFIIMFYMQKTYSPLLLKIWINFSVIHFTFLFLLIHQFSLALMKQGNDDNVYLFGTRNSTMFIYLGAVMLAVNFIFGFLMARFVYEPIKSKYIAAIRTTIPDLISLLFKALDCILLTVVTDIQTQKYIRLIAMTFLLGYRLFIYLSQCPYYYYLPMRIFQGFNCVQIAMVAVNILTILVNEAQTVKGNNLGYMMLICGAFFAKASDMRMEMMVKKFGLRDISQILTKDHFYKKLMAVDYILDQGSISAHMEKKARENFSEFLFYGIVKAHKVKCKKQSCGCDLILETGKMSSYLPVKEDQRALMREFQFQLIYDLFEAFHEPEVKVTLANFIYENKQDSYAAAVTIIHRLKLDQGSIELKVVSVKLLEKIEKMVLTNYDATIDVLALVDYQALSFQLRKLVEKNIRKYLRFWEIYKGADPSAKELYDFSVKVNEEADKIAKIWTKIMQKYAKHAYKDHLLYGLYQSLTRSSPYSAEKTLQKFFGLSAMYSGIRQKDILVTPDTVTEPQNVMIYISMHKEKIGHIMFSTRNIEELSGYSSYELIDKNVNQLMPRFYREKHNKILRAHIDYGRTNIRNRNRAIYVRKKDGYILPASLYISLFPYFQQHLLYLGIVRPVQTFDQFILVLPDGVIDSYSQTIAKLLNLKVDSKRRLRLKYICPELDNLHKGFNYLRNGVWSKLRQLSLSKRDYSQSNSSKHKHSGNLNQTRSLNDSNNTDGAMSEHTGTGRRTTFQDGMSMDFSTIHTKDLVEGKTEMAEELTNPNEFDDWIRIYELFTSTGVPIRFAKFEEKAVVAKVVTSKSLEFTTMIIEERVFNSQMRIFRLQTTSLEEDDNQENDYQFQEEGESQAQGQESPQRSENSPQKKEEEGGGVKTEAGEALLPPTHNFKQSNPNAPDASISNISVGEDGASGMRNNLNMLEMSANFDAISDDGREVSTLGDDLLGLRNPFTGTARESLTPVKNLRTEEAQETEYSQPLTGKEQLFQAKHGSLLNNPAAMLDSRGGVQVIPNPTMEKQISVQSTMRLDSPNNNRIQRVDPSDDNRISEQKKSDEKQDLKKFFQRHKILYNDQVDGDLQGKGGKGNDKQSTHSSAQSARISSKIERAIYSANIDNTIRSLNYIVLLLCLATFICLIVEQVIIRSNLTKLRANIEVQQLSTQKLYSIVEIDRRARIVNLIARGLVNSNRITSDDITMNIESMLSLSSQLSGYNTQIRLSINKISAKERQRFYEEIPVKQRGSQATILSMNTFDASDEIINSVIHINTLLPTGPTATDDDLTFILGNSLNDLVVKNEEVASILLDDNSLSLSQIENTLLAILVIITVIAAGIFAMVMRSEMRFIKRKTSFLDTFFRIKSDETEENLFIVNAFYASLIESDREDLFMQKVADNNMQLASRKKLETKKNYRDFKAKSANIKSLNQRTYLNLGFTLFFMGMFSAIFIILFSTFFSHKGLINKLMNTVVNMDINLFQFGLTFASLYEYVSEDGTTQIVNEPISTEWESLYTILTSSVGFFDGFVDLSSSTNETVFLLSGDLCSTLFSDRDCYNEAAGVGSQGILGIGGFIMKALRETKDYYNSSAKDTNAKVTTLEIQDFIATEIAYPIYMTRSYSSMNSLLNSQFYSEVDNFSSTSLIISVVGAVALLLLAEVIWTRIIKSMEKERESFRGMMRIIPVNVIMGNRYLKSYLISNSQDILDSIKNRL